MRVWTDDYLTRPEDAIGLPPASKEAEGNLVELSAAVAAVRRAQPTDDLLSLLVTMEYQGAPLNDAQVIGMCMLLIAGGHETTAKLIANGVRLFEPRLRARVAELARRLAARPGRDPRSRVRPRRRDPGAGGSGGDDRRRRRPRAPRPPPSSTPPPSGCAPRDAPTRCYLVRHADGRVESLNQAGSGRLNPQAPPIEWIHRPKEPPPGSTPTPVEVHARCTFGPQHGGSPGPRLRRRARRARSTRCSASPCSCRARRG